MTSLPLQDPALFPSPEGELKKFSFGPWTVLEYAVVPSTNLVAAGLPAWHVVRAESQTAGRGRFERRWVSDPGGLWFSAVLPVSGRSAAGLFPLMVGLAVCDALRTLGVTGVHMRWPNDVLVGHRKLAGLLIDQFFPGLAVAGIGLNIANRPENADAGLRGQVARLAELVSPVPALGEVLRDMLACLERICGSSSASASEGLLPRINALWQPRQKVQIELDTQTVAGEFCGVDAAGRLALRGTPNAITFYEPHQVRLLREII